MSDVSPHKATAPVVAGYDESTAAPAVLEYAAEEARQRHSSLLLVHGFTWPWIYPPLLPTPSAEPPDPHPRSHADRQLAAVAEGLRQAHPDLVVHTRLADGHGAQVLVEHSRGAALVVVGHRGSGGFAELLIGSVAIHTTAHAHCPVIVVRGAPVKPDGAVVLGVDGSADGQRAAEFAYATAARRAVPLVAVTVGPPEQTHYREPQPPDDFVTTALREWSGRYPDVDLQPAIAHAASPAATLLQAADQAALVVVGSRGLGGLRGLLLGSVGRALIEHAPCPVAIVRPSD